MDVDVDVDVGMDMGIGMCVGLSDGIANPKGRGVGLMRYASGLIRFIRRHGIGWGRIKCVLKLANSHGKST